MTKHDSHIDERSSHDHHAPKYTKEFKEKTEWIYLVRQPKSYLDKFIDFVKPKSSNTAYNIDLFDTLSLSQQIPRIVFALEKLAMFNHHAFDEKDRRNFTPSNMGLIQKGYSNILTGVQFYWLVTIFSKRNFSRSNLCNFAAFVLISKFVLKPLPMRFKEAVRYQHAKERAYFYLKKQNGNLAIFKKILNPKTTVESLHHLSV